jgi:hypothetical protein
MSTLEEAYDQFESTMLEALDAFRKAVSANGDQPAQKSELLYEPDYSTIPAKEEGHLFTEKSARAVWNQLLLAPDTWFGVVEIGNLVGRTDSAARNIMVWFWDQGLVQRDTSTKRHLFRLAPHARRQP